MPNRASTVCFSGHRSYPSTAEDALRLAAAVENAYTDGYRTFISGMAPGFDLAAARAVLRLRSRSGDVRLVCAVPFEKQSRDFSPDDLRRYDALLGSADRVEILAGQWRPGIYYRRNDWMVERSSRLIAWYDASTEPSSGTRHTVRAAVRAGLAVVNLFRPTATLF